jgi:hypothetical protein
MEITFEWLRNCRGEVDGGFSLTIFDSNNTQLFDSDVFPYVLYVNINTLDIVVFSDRVTLPEISRY